jgi:mono/diheme cytochrome c family protein
MFERRLLPSSFWVAFTSLLVVIVSGGLTGAGPTLAQAPVVETAADNSQPPPPDTPAAAAQPALSPRRALLDRYCVGCHNEKLRSGGLALDTADVTKVAERSDIWEHVIYKLRAGMMPPVGRPRPDQPQVETFLAYLETELDTFSRSHPNPGRTETFHRLNRAEYGNAVRELLALDVDVAALLPSDDAHANGFDNMADVLTVSPSLLDRYMSAAAKISRMAVGTAPPGPGVTTYSVNPLLDQTERLSEDLPFGSRGGLAIRHYFPVDGEYTARIKLQTNYVEYIRGLGEPHDLDVRLDGVLVKRFTVGGGALGGFGRFQLLCDQRLSSSATRDGSLALLSFFLWSSIPDESSCSPPRTGVAGWKLDELRSPPAACCEQQVRRMLADPRSKRWSRTLPAVAGTAERAAPSPPTRPSSRSSTRTCARRSSARPSCSFDSQFREDRA